MKINSNKVKTDRAFFDSLGNYYPPDSTVKISNEVIAGVPCYWFVPEAPEEDKLIIYLHGGMFGFGSIHSHKPMVSYFASTLSSKVLFIDYGLAPEKPFPHGLIDVQKVYRQIINEYPKAKIYLIGDSAGGGLSVSLIKQVTEEKLRLPERVILLSPWIFLKCNTESHERRKKMDPILNKEMLLEYANYYATDRWNEADPSQLDFNSFPPLFILVGGNEILFDDSKLFYEKIKKIQPNTEMKEYVNQIHVWPMADIKSKDSEQALIEIRNFLQETNH